jgi:hypothetical protein
MRFSIPPIALVLLASACTPLTQYRQSTMVPAAAPTTVVGAPVEAGQLAVGANVSTYWTRDWITDEQDLTGWFPMENDPGLYMSPLSVGGHLRYGVTEFLELGASFDYAHSNWAGRSSLGVLPLSDNANLMTVGPHITAGYMFGVVGFGGTLELSWTQLPYARYEYTGQGEWWEHYGYGLGDAEDLYTLQEAGVCHPWQLRWTNALQIRHKAFDSAVGFTLAPQLTNNGFSNSEVPVYELGAMSMIPVLDLGFTLPGVHLGLQGWYAAMAAEATDNLYNGLGGRLVMEYRSPGKD